MFSKGLAVVPVKSLVCHPAAVAIFDMWTSTHDSKRYRNFSTELLLSAQRSRPVHVVSLDCGGYGFFCNWDLVTEFREREIREIEVIKHESLSNADIQRCALFSEIGKAIYLPDGGYAPYLYLYHLFDYSHQDTPKCFCCEPPRNSNRAVMLACRLTRSQMRVRIAYTKSSVSELERALREGKENE